MFKQALYVSLFVSLWAGCAFSQDFRASITGVVKDPSGAVIPGASVKATNDTTNEITEVKTNKEGVYTISYLNPGRYTVEFSSSGFKTLRHENLVLQVNDKQNLPATLQVGAAATEMTVSAAQELIQSTSADRGLVFDPIKTQDLPLNGRQSYMLLALTPGVIFTQQQFGANGFSGTRGWDTNGSYRINGGRSGTNQFLLNGAPISVNGSWQLAVNVEAIQEFKVQTSTYDAQYGRTAGGTVNTILKSGTNALHGDVFDYWRNSVLDANTIQNNANGSPKGLHNQHQYGGIVQFPVRKDKDFVMLSFEGWKEVVPFPTQQSTPPLDIRDGQHFSEYGIKIYDPTTSRPCTAADNCPKGSNYVRSPFPGNIIPANRISPIGAKILSLYPAPNFSGGNSTQLTNNFLQPQNTGRYDYFQPIGRWDHVFNDKTRLYAVVTEQHGSEFRNNNGFQPPAQRGNIRSERTDQNYVADVNRILNNSTVLDVRLSFGRFTANFPDGEDDFDFTYSDLGMQNMPIPPTVNRKTAPTFTLQNYPQIVGTSYSWNVQNQWDVAPSVVTVHGKQTWHYGFEFAHIGRGDAGPGSATGRLNFDTNYWTRQFDQKDQGQNDGSGIANLLLGVPNSGNVDYNDSYYRNNQYYAFYFQDDWRIAPRLMLNLGLRYDIQRPLTEINNRLNAGFDYDAKNPYSDAVLANWNQQAAAWNAANPNNPYPAAPPVVNGGKLFAGVNGQPRRPYDTDWTDIQPRVGVAWRITDTTVLRGGFGIYHKWDDHANTTNGFSLSTNYLSSLNGFTPSAGLTGPYSLQNPFPNGYQVPPGNQLGLATLVGNGIGFDSRLLPIMRTYEASFGVQQQLPKQFLLSADYTFNRSVHDTTAAQIGFLSADQLRDAQQNPNKYTQNVPNPFYGLIPQNTDFGGSKTIQAMRLYSMYPQFNGVTRYTNPWGRYRYDSLQLSLEKRFLGDRNSAGAFTFTFGYTFSKSYEENHFLGLKNPNIGDYYAPGITTPIKELDYQDVPQSITFAGVWDLPFGRARHFASGVNAAVDALIGGWSLDWIWTYYSGFPTGMPNAVFGPVGNTPASACSSYTVKNQNNQHWFNNYNGQVTPTNPNGWNCYSDFAPFTVSQVKDRFDWIRNPAEPQVNIALQKTFKFNERLSMLFRGEAFNLSNTPIRPPADTNWHNASFGTTSLNQQNFPRLVQLAAKFMF